MNSHSGQRKEIVPTNTLFLSNVPVNSCTIPSIFKHFKKYGHIQSIWAFGTDASITFTTKEDAIKAYKSPEAFSNNRFVHYHYHINPDKAESLLSLIVNREKVNSVRKEVADDIEKEQRRTIILQSTMKASTANDQANSAANDKSYIEELVLNRDTMEKTIQELKNALKEEDDIQKIEEIKSRIKEREGMLSEINELIK